MRSRAAATAAGKRAAADSRDARRARRNEVPSRDEFSPRAGVLKRTGSRRAFAPANPRRVSGPVRGRAETGATARGASGVTARAASAASAATARAATGVTARAAATVTAAATALATAAEVAPRIVRPAPRITRPARHVPRPVRPARSVAPTTGTRGARALGFVRTLPDHALTDRLVRGRAWIPILGALLAGIVALQVSLLRLNASMGRSIEQATTLQTNNGLLREQVAALASAGRIERIAAGMGLTMAAPEQIDFLSRRSGGIARKALANMAAPAATALANVQAAGSTTNQSSTNATDTATTTTPSSTATAPGAGGAVAGTGQTGVAGASAPTTAASGTSSMAVGADPADAAGGTAGAAGTQPAALTQPGAGLTGAGATGQPPTGGASTGTGG